MSLENNIQDCLFAYVQIIIRFEKALIDTYHLPDDPYQCQRLFPSSGKVKDATEVIEYKFHGSGCSFSYSDIEVHYDYLIPEADYIITVPWKFWRFVATYLSTKGESDITEDEVADAMERLNDSRAIQKVHPDYLQYQVSFLWFETYTFIEHYG